jgi:predicted  nucleic acid-binding Zn-ribbon protein
LRAPRGAFNAGCPARGARADNPAYCRVEKVAMADDVRDQIHKLIRLQSLETEIRNIRQVLDQVEERTSRLDAQLKEFSDAVESGKGLLQELNKGYRAFESEMQSIQGRIDKSNEKLRAVKTNKEYQAGLKEIEDLGVIGSKIEDEMIAGLDRIEQASATLKTHQARLDARAGEIRCDKECVLKEAEEGRLRLKRVEAEAGQVVETVAAGVLVLYRRVKAAKADELGVAAVCAATCRGCNVNIPPQMYNELQRNDRLKHCPNCDRIIYWEEEDRPE